MIRKELRIINVREMEEDYAPKDDIFTDLDEEVIKLMNVVKGLDVWKSRIIYLYCELGTYKAVAEVLNCSISSVAKIIKQIREEVKEKL